MAREWEEAPTEVFDQRVDGVLYRRYNRRTAALEERRFNTEDLSDQDLRRGDTRRFLTDDGYGDLNEIYREKNTFEGLID
jgi:hypothetical protein